MQLAILIITLLSITGSALIAGAFFAFSTFVMRALAELPARDGIAAMQSINVVVINPFFIGVFIATAIVSAVATGIAFMRWEPTRSIEILIGAVAYIIGTFGLTIRCNVPLNDRLARLKPADGEAETIWRDYLKRWVFWNHVRTINATVAMLCFTLSLTKFPH